MGEKLTKAQLRQAYTEWAETQDPKIKVSGWRFCFLDRSTALFMFIRIRMFRKPSTDREKNMI